MPSVTRPWYLALLPPPGHTTATCPYRAGHHAEAACAKGGRGILRSGARSVSVGAATAGGRGVLAVLRRAEVSGVRPGNAVTLASFVRTGWQVDAAILRLHSRRVTNVEFVPDKPWLVVSVRMHARPCARSVLRGFLAAWIRVAPSCLVILACRLCGHAFSSSKRTLALLFSPPP